MTACLPDQFRAAGYVVVPQALPRDTVDRWRHDAVRMTQYARSIRRTDGEFQLTYRVVTGDSIRDLWPELFAFYTDQSVLDWVKHVTCATAIYASANLQSAVNLNIMDDTDSVYRWHFDAEPYTALLYLNDLSPEDGGALEIIPNCAPHQVPDPNTARPIQLVPAAGTLLLMDGTRCYHRATPMLRPALRFSVPMVYPDRVSAQRPAGLDSYLYESRG